MAKRHEKYPTRPSSRRAVDPQPLQPDPPAVIAECQRVAQGIAKELWDDLHPTVSLNDDEFFHVGVGGQNIIKNPNKKFKVYVRGPKGNVVVVRFGDPNMSIKRDNPERRKSFRARHGCDNPGPKWKAKYWSCYQWRSGAKVDN